MSVVLAVSAAAGSCDLSMILRAGVRRCLRCGVMRKNGHRLSAPLNRVFPVSAFHIREERSRAPELLGEGSKRHLPAFPFLPHFVTYFPEDRIMLPPPFIRDAVGIP